MNLPEEVKKKIEEYAIDCANRRGTHLLNMHRDCKRIEQDVEYGYTLRQEEIDGLNLLVKDQGTHIRNLDKEIVSLKAEIERLKQEKEETRIFIEKNFNP